MKTTAEISNTNTQVKLSVGDELAQTLLAMDGRDKEIAYAMMQGMIAGKNLPITATRRKQRKEVRIMANTHTDEIFNVYGALDNLNKRMKIVEEKVPDYTADMLEVYRNLGALTKRIAELEELITKPKLKR